MMEKVHFPFSAMSLSVSLALGTFSFAAQADYAPAPQSDFSVINNEEAVVDQSNNLAGNWGDIFRLGVGTNLLSESTPDVKGTLTIGGGREVTAFSSVVGSGAGSQGKIAISGAGSKLSLLKVNDPTNGALKSQLILGTRGGSGELKVTDNGSFYSDDSINLGYIVGSSGTINVSTGGSVEVVRSMIIGSQGRGELNILNGGKTIVGTSGQFIVGFENGGEGRVLVSGAGSELTVGRLMLVGTNLAGLDSVGTITINDGAVVNVNSAPGSASIGLGYNNISTGIINIGAAANESAVKAGTLNAENIVIGTKGVINFNHTDADYEFASNTRGTGSLEQRGISSVTTLTGTNQYTGATTVFGGTLRAGSSAAFSSGSAFRVDTQGNLDLNGFDQTLSSLDLAGQLTFQPTYSGAGTFTPVNLTVGDFVGSGGLIVFNAVLANDSSLSDKLNVTGNTSGTALVSVNNAGGLGDQTLNGMELINVTGSSDGEFTQQGRITAGAYEYQLTRGEGANNKNWYLTTYTQGGVPPVTPPVTPPVNPDDNNGGTDTGTNTTHVYRPEAGSYLANNAAANTLFMTRLHDRLGETQYTDVLTGEQKVTSMWMRNVGGHNRFRDGSGQLKTQSNRYVLQIGGDLAQWSSNGLDRWHMGVMTGYANNRSKTHSGISGYSSRGQVTGYSAGLYGTWFANAEDKSGLYLDSWVLYNWFDNKVDGDQLSSEKYKSKGVTASIESGYSLKLGQSENASYWLQPKAQVVWMGVKADDHTEANGTRVSDESNGNFATRLGLRASMLGHNKIDEGKNREFQPFVEVNWLHNSNDTGVKMNSTLSEQQGAKNIGEVKVGVEGQLSQRLTMWGNVAQQIGDEGYSDTSTMLGMKYSF